VRVALLIAGGAALLTGAPGPAPAITAARANGLIAFFSTRDGTSEIYTMNPDGTQQRRLTVNPAQDVSPAWSPDGTRIAFASNRDSDWEIYAMNADGGNLRRLTKSPGFDGSPAWSPDGSQIAFSSARDGNSEIYVMNADGSGQTRLTNNPADDGAPAWAPDDPACGPYAGEIAFESDRSGNYDLFATQPDGTGLQNLTRDPTQEFDPNWAPDCSALAFDRVVDGNYDVYRLDLEMSTVTQLTFSPDEDSRPVWSPDGELISFASLRDGHYEIYVMNSSNGSGQADLSNSFPNTDNQPTWQPVAKPTVATPTSLAWRQSRAAAAIQLTCGIGPRTAAEIDGTDSSDVICSLGPGQILNGKKGDDHIGDSGGKDTVYGGRGRDVINTRDGAKDVVSGGPGVDEINADRFDVVRKPTGDHVVQ
jgi:TolB protein